MIFTNLYRMGDIMLFGVQWYYWLILALAVVLLIFAWHKAIVSGKKRRERLKREAAIWKRDYDLRQKFTVLTDDKLRETEDSELLHAVAMNIQVMLENESNMTDVFNLLPEEKKYIYALEYFDEDCKHSLSTFFKNNGKPLVPVVPAALTAIGASKYLSIFNSIEPMYDGDSDVSIDYGLVAKADEEFSAIYDSDELCRLCADYIKKNKSVFLS